MLYFHFSFDVRCDNLSWNCCPPHATHCAISSTHGTQTKNLPTAMPLKGWKWSKGSRLSKVWPRPKRGAQSTLKELRWNHGIKWNDYNRKVGLSLGEVEESQYLSSSASSSLAPKLHSFGMWIEVWVSTDACSLMSTLFHADWYCTGESSGLERLRKKTTQQFPGSWLQGKSIFLRFHVHHETLLVQFFCGFLVWKRHETACHSWNRRPHCRQCQEELLPNKMNEANVWHWAFPDVFSVRMGSFLSLKCIQIKRCCKDNDRISASILSESIHPPSRHGSTTRNGVVFWMFWEWSREQCRKNTLATWKTI